MTTKRAQTPILAIVWLPMAFVCAGGCETAPAVQRLDYSFGLASYAQVPGEFDRAADDVGRTLRRVGWGLLSTRTVTQDSQETEPGAVRDHSVVGSRPRHGSRLRRILRMDRRGRLGCVTSPYVPIDVREDVW